MAEAKMAEINVDDMAADFERRARHLEACRASDVQALRDGLISAASRFADLADILEKEGHHQHVDFLRASAERYRRVGNE